MSKEAYADSLEHWAKCFRDGTLDDSFANEIAYLLEDKAHDLRTANADGMVGLSTFLTDYWDKQKKPHDRHALSNKLITNALKRGDV
jgi:hypothetical protein